MSRHKPLFKPVRDRNPILVYLVGMTLFVIVCAAAFQAQNLPVIGGGTTYTADFSEAAGLRPDNEVRVAGVKVGTVQSVKLHLGKVRVSFRVRHTWVGDASTAAIAIKTVLGDKYLALDPLGSRPQRPSAVIGSDRTMAPYDVTEAFDDLSGSLQQLDSAKLAQSLQSLSGTFQNTPPAIRTALTGVTAFSKTVSKRDAQLRELLQSANRFSGTMAGQTQQIQTLLRDGNLLLGELSRRRDAVHGLLVGTQNLSEQLSGLVDDNQAQLAPALRSLEKVTTLLERNKADLDRALALAGPYTRLLGNALGNGRWMDGYLCGVVPKNYLPPGTPPAKGCMPPKQGGS
ncbi:MCE family protein [Actinomadura rupiterrae]|uniref:MCE family protein n=1 Tax=Actinomadura rupiterrae TaxID=559627 RepID=UPI0020A3054A|nr:MCE family protein [Actinomadura rupiterrae]MCP2339122.1 phospholipid/cholesterol/gamma-HCH transport system substrate-binding protein [Actinomadura rupiterrae]